MSQAINVSYQTSNPGRLPISGAMEWIMFIAFGGPAFMLVAMGISEFRKSPMILMVSPIGFFPFLVVWTLKRLLSRYALRAFDNGDIEIVYPFTRKQIAKEHLSKIVTKSVYNYAAKTNELVYLFGDSAGQTLAKVSCSAFSKEQWQKFFTALQKNNPRISLE